MTMGRDYPRERLMTMGLNSRHKWHYPVQVAVDLDCTVSPKRGWWYYIVHCVDLVVELDCII